MLTVEDLKQSVRWRESRFRQAAVVLKVSTTTTGKGRRCGCGGGGSAA